MIHETNRKVRFILMNFARIILAFAAVYGYIQNRSLLFFVSSLVFIITFFPYVYKLIFKKESAALFDIVLIFIIFSLLSFWEIRGTYSNLVFLTLLMNLAEAIAIGLLGMTLVYTFFKYSRIEAHPLAISLFSFCFSFTVGAVFELGEVAFDNLFNFSVHDSGLFGTSGDLTVYFIGSAIVSFVGYRSLKKGNPILVSSFLESLVEKNPRLFGIKGPAHDDHVKETLSLIKNGESKNLEFKSTLRKNLHTNNFDKQIEHSILKTINAYLNSEGGTLLVGVSDKGEILGIHPDQFSSTDHAQRHLIRLIGDHIGPEFLPLIRATCLNIDGKDIIKVDCKKSQKETFVKNGNDEHFYVRQGSLSIPLTGRALLNYIEGVFRENTK